MEKLELDHVLVTVPMILGKRALSAKLQIARIDWKWQGFYLVVIATPPLRILNFS
ncbi:MAG: hypothetical protein CM15mP49_03540 [Actinomycetota bacterium]|nr:MAG: hypothetical protein CM15mP49_03540 [Actinomycetota bacterium]